jgi:hypothetical protein
MEIIAFVQAHLLEERWRRQLLTTYRTVRCDNILDHRRSCNVYVKVTVEICDFTYKISKVRVVNISVVSQSSKTPETPHKSSPKVLELAYVL